ncbi:hypothetical protein KI387_008890 [Taxus chinensis]|uniref:PGG domain-containing protein n=1 Tax=Taxus chinensis TaxID=29808 RepID=A0AA38CRI1_TAXCH|nr:hypothetical protein KI387_008890 [Taxus chinensis]
MLRELFIAAKKGYLDGVQNVYRQRPRHVTNGVTFEGNSALHIAAREGHVDVVRWILSVNPCLAKARNNDKNTALHEAAKKARNQEVVRILLKHNKCAVYRRNQFGETPLIIASEHGHVDSARLLLAAIPLFLVFWPRDDRQTCLYAAASEGHLEVVKLILQEKSSCFNILRLILLIGDETGVTPLHAAVHGGHLEIVREILKIEFNGWWGMDCWDKSLMTKKDKFGRCAIHVAAMKGHWDIIDLFMSMMPDCVEIRSTCLKTAVHFAVEYDQLQVVQKLLHENEDEVKAKMVSYDYDIWGNTALHLAAMNGVDPQFVEYLLSFPGVNVNRLNNKGMSPFDMASAAENQEKPNFCKIASILKDAGATQSLICHSRSSLPPWQSQQINNQIGGVEENKILDVDTLVASLIATVTFAAIFQVPGGTRKDSGLANMSSQRVFHVFLFSDCLAFFASMTVVIAWIFRERVQTKLVADRSALAKLSMLSLGTSIVSTGLAFLSATILVTVPRDLESLDKKHDKQEYQMIFAVEMMITFLAPLLALVFLSLAWMFEYNFRATNERQARLKRELKRVLISTLPVAAIVLIIICVYIVTWTRVVKELVAFGIGAPRPGRWSPAPGCHSPASGCPCLEKGNQFEGIPWGHHLSTFLGLGLSDDDWEVTHITF